MMQATATTMERRVAWRKTPESKLSWLRTVSPILRNLVFSRAAMRVSALSFSARDASFCSCRSW